MGATGVTYPGRYPEVIAVSGTDLGYGFASAFPGSRYGPQVTPSAPFYVQSMRVAGTINPYWSGTSFAAPAVSAVAALVWSANPSWTAAMVRSRLMASAVDLGPAGWDQQCGNGRVSAVNAVQPPFTVSISGAALLTLPGTYTWTAQPSGASNP